MVHNVSLQVFIQFWIRSLDLIRESLTLELLILFLRLNLNHCSNGESKFTGFGLGLRRDSEPQAVFESSADRGNLDSTGF
jgi:hypothetical protein